MRQINLAIQSLFTLVSLLLVPQPWTRQPHFLLCFRQLTEVSSPFILTEPDLSG